MAAEKQKVVTITVLETALEECDARYATKEELEAGGVDLEFATAEDVHAIFAKLDAGDPPEEPSEPAT